MIEHMSFNPCPVRNDLYHFLSPCTLDMAEKSDKPQLSGGHAFPIIPFVVWTLLSIDTKTDHIIPEPQVEKLWEEVQKLEPQAGDQASNQAMNHSLPEVTSDFKIVLMQVVLLLQQSLRTCCYPKHPLEDSAYTLHLWPHAFCRHTT